VILWCCIIGYGITLKLSKSKYKIRYNFMGSSLVFKFLDINVLNYYCYFHTDCLTYFKNKKCWKIKNVEKHVFYRKIKKTVYKRLLQLCSKSTHLSCFYQLRLLSVAAPWRPSLHDKHLCRSSLTSELTMLTLDYEDPATVNRKSWKCRCNCEKLTKI